MVGVLGGVSRVVILFSLTGPGQGQGLRGMTRSALGGRGRRVNVHALLGGVGWDGVMAGYGGGWGREGRSRSSLKRDSLCNCTARTCRGVQTGTTFE